MSDRWTELGREFDRWAQSYDEESQEGLGFLEGHLRSLELAAALLPVRPGQEVLDIGVGTGAFGEIFARRGLSVTGVDISPRMLEIARLKHPDWRLMPGHFLDLPLEDASVDVAVSALAFHHLETDERPQALREVFRVLRGDVFLLVDILFADAEAKQSARDHLAERWEEENYALYPDLARVAGELGLHASFTRLSLLHGAVLLHRAAAATAGR